MYIVSTWEWCWLGLILITLANYFTNSHTLVQVCIQTHDENYITWKRWTKREMDRQREKEKDKDLERKRWRERKRKRETERETERE